MKQREVQDSNKLSWTCVQAFAGTDGEAAKEAVKRSESDDQVVVVCTPSGGAQTVRLHLHPEWLEKMSDQELVTNIQNAAPHPGT